MEIIDFFIKIFFGAIGFFDFKSVEGFGVDDTFDSIVVIDYWEISETRFIEFI